MYNLKNTTFGYMFDNPTLNEKLSSYINTYPNHYKLEDNIIGILGRDKVEQDIPRFAWVIDYSGNFIMDLTTLYDGKLNYGTTYQQLVIGAKFSKEYASSEDVPMLLKTTMIDIYVDMISKTLVKELLLNNEILNAMRALLYFHYFIGVLEVDNEEAYRYVNKKSVIIDDTLKEYMANYEYKGMSSLMDTLLFIGDKYNDSRLLKLTKAELAVLVGRGWISKDGNGTILSGLEHLPSMFALIYTANKFSLFQRSNIYRILKDGNYSLSSYLKRADSMLEDILSIKL